MIQEAKVKSCGLICDTVPVVVLSYWSDSDVMVVLPRLQSFPYSPISLVYNSPLIKVDFMIISPGMIRYI